MRRMYLCVGLIAAVGLTAVFVWRSVGHDQGGRDGNGTPKQPLPLTQVILFNSGVGYFQREGTLEGSARVDLTFSVTDINDLLKSLVLQDGGEGKISAISYDSQEPVERTLQTFALDLTYNPTLGQLLNQARGEKLEVAMQQAAGNQPLIMTGVIMGMEPQKQPHGKDQLMDVDVLNLLCAEGIRSVPLAQVQRLRFLNAGLDSEFRRALEVLASAHNSQKRTVSLHFAGKGERPVKLGYVVENPIWKTSYRLVLDRKGKANLQGWAVVENTTDEDWKDVRMALVSSRPISYQMDLYQPLFVPRPTVEPERFRSLRPPVSQGAIAPGNPAQQGQQAQQNPGGFNMMGMGGMNMMGMGGMNMMGMQGGNFNGAVNNRFQMRNDNNFLLNGTNNRLTFEEYQQRRQQLREAREEARQKGSAIAQIDPHTKLPSIRDADDVGEDFQYVLDQKINLPRQKSALLPIVHQDVTAARLSVYNQAVHPKFPLQTLRLKNSLGLHLMQGPVSIYEGSTYVGDGRLPDLQVNEERLVSFAIDQGVEVLSQQTEAPQRLIKARIDKGVLITTHKLRETRQYLLKNRSRTARVVLVEHPARAEWKLATEQKPIERTRDFHRFELSVPAGKSVTFDVPEERETLTSVSLVTADNATLKLLLNAQLATEELKAAVRKAVDHHVRLAAMRLELAQIEKQLKTINEDQGRLRANIDKVPQTSAAYKRYVEKFDKQETEIEKLQARVAELQESEKKQQKEFEDTVKGLTVD